MFLWWQNVLLVILSIIVVVVNPKVAEAQPRIAVSYSTHFSGLSKIEKLGLLEASPDMKEAMADYRQQMKLVSQMRFEGVEDPASARLAFSEICKDAYETSVTLIPDLHNTVIYHAVLDDVLFRMRRTRKIDPANLFNEDQYVKSMRFSELQKEHLKSLDSAFIKKMAKVVEDVESDLKSVFRDNYYSGREILTDDQWKAYRDVYGTPAVLNVEFVLFDGFGFRSDYSANVDAEYHKVTAIVCGEDEMQRQNNPAYSTSLLPLRTFFDNGFGFSKESKDRVMASLVEDGGLGFNSRLELGDNNRIAALLTNKVIYPDSIQKNLSEKELKKLRNVELQFRLRDLLFSGLQSPLLQEHLQLNDQQKEQLSELKIVIRKEIQKVLVQYGEQFEDVINALNKEYYEMFSPEQKAAFNLVFEKQNYAHDLFLGLTKF